MVRLIRPGERDQWLQLRRNLWPDCPEEIHRKEMDQLSDDESYAVFVSEGPYGLDGFLEVSIPLRLRNAIPVELATSRAGTSPPEAAGLESGDN